VLHYLNGKADWVVRGLPCEPAPPMREKLRVLPYFINNLTPGIRAKWIAISRRGTVVQCAKDDLSRLRSFGSADASSARTDVTAVILNAEGALLGAMEPNGMNPAPQTIRPDMTHRLATELLEKHRYILITTSFGKYLGRYEPPAT